MTLTTPIKGYFVIPRRILDIFYRHTKFGDSRFIRNGEMIAGMEIENGSCDADYALLGVICYESART